MTYVIITVAIKSIALKNNKNICGDTFFDHILQGITSKINNYNAKFLWSKNYRVFSVTCF